MYTTKEQNIQKTGLIFPLWANCCLSIFLKCWIVKYVRIFYKKKWDIWMDPLCTYLCSMYLLHNNYVFKSVKYRSVINVENLVQLWLKKTFYIHNLIAIFSEIFFCHLWFLKYSFQFCWVVFVYFTISKNPLWMLISPALLWYSTTVIALLTNYWVEKVFWDFLLLG